MEENWASKARLVPLFVMGWEASMPSGIFEHILDQGCRYLLGHKYMVYVINKQLNNYVRYIN
jgi:hypothetical protein